MCTVSIVIIIIIVFLFQGKSVEQSHDFQKFLEQLKRKNSEEGAVEEFEDLLNGRHGSKGLVVFIREISEV